MLDIIGGIFGGAGTGAVLKTAGGVLTALLIVPALLKLFLVTVDEGSAAIRTRNGRPIVRRARRGGDRAGELVVLHPGTHAAFPVLAWYRMVDVRARSTDLPPRHLTGASGHQHLIHASFDWRPIPSGQDLRVLELDVVGVTERAGNIVGGALRDVVRGHGGAALPGNDALSDVVVAACAARVRERCGVELLGVTVTGDALSDGFLLAEALGAADGRRWTASDAAAAFALPRPA